jgi:hypothetical protein
LHVHVVLLLTAELLVRRTVTGDEVDAIMRWRYRKSPRPMSASVVWIGRELETDYLPGPIYSNK